MVMYRLIAMNDGVSLTRAYQQRVSSLHGIHLQIIYKPFRAPAQPCYSTWFKICAVGLAVVSNTNFSDHVITRSVFRTSSHFN